MLILNVNFIVFLVYVFLLVYVHVLLLFLKETYSMNV
jgi:hypothetical protein